MAESLQDQTSSSKETDSEALRTLKHDINNQLSNILLSLEQLRFEVADASEDFTFYVNSIAISAKKIHSLVKEAK